MLADGMFFEDGTFKPFDEINLKVIQDRFAELVLAEFAKRELITDDVMTQVLSQEHTEFSVWIGDPFQDEQSDKFVARYVEWGPLSLEKLSIEDDLVVYTTKDGNTHEFDALEFLALLSSHNLSAVALREGGSPTPMSPSPATTDTTHAALAARGKSGLP